MRQHVWLYFTPTSIPQRFKFQFCGVDMIQNPTIAKDHILKSTCRAPGDVRGDDAEAAG